MLATGASAAWVAVGLVTARGVAGARGATVGGVIGTAAGLGAGVGRLTGGWLAGAFCLADFGLELIQI